MANITLLFLFYTGSLVYVRRPKMGACDLPKDQRPQIPETRIERGKRCTAEFQAMGPA